MFSVSSVNTSKHKKHKMDLLVQNCTAHSVGAANQLFSLLIQTILSAQCGISPPEMWPRDYGDQIDENGLDEYDFIVVGAGTAGSVVAHRLSENPNWKVLLIEAGGDPPIESQIPAMFFNLQKTKVDWGYHAEKSDKACKSMPAGCYWPRGKVLGGSSAINAMLYLRGNSVDYNNWAKLGNPGWDWENVLKYFKKSEDNQNSDFVGKYHGTGGPLTVGPFDGDVPMREVLRQAAEELGYVSVQDFNGDTFVGFTSLQGTTFNGSRISPAKAFLSSIPDRKNLNIIKHAHVKKLIISKTGHVDSLEFRRNGLDYSVKARNEYIVSAGSINTPQLLMISGIGPTDHLIEKKVEVVKNLPVGKNLQDHLIVPILFKFHTGSSKPITNEELAHAIYIYALYRQGPLAAHGTVNFNGMVDTLNKTGTFPDIQYHFFYQRQNSPDLPNLLEMLNYEKRLTRNIINENQKHDVLLVWVTLLRPKSIGHIELRTNNPFDKPKIYANYLDDHADIETLIRGIRIQNKFLDTATFSDHEAKRYRWELPECDKLEFDSDLYWECYIRHLGSSVYHPVGTAKMGPLNDETTVVDSRLKVKGIENLRVIDASIMPTIVSGNTMAPTIMIGEKGSDLIKEDWKYIHHEL